MRSVRNFCALILMIVLSATLAVAATPTLTLTPNLDPPSPAVGPPVVIQVSATNFPASTAVDIYFDTVDVALAVTSATGGFSKINVTVPTTAVPGTHYVTGVARGTTGTSAQATFTVQANWAQFRYSAVHHGRNPYENVLNTTNVGSIDLDWSYATTGALTSSPAVSGGIVYVGSADDNLYAINATTGVLVWKFLTGNSIVDSSPAVVGTTDYFCSSDYNLYAINATTGAQIWKFATGGAINSSPAVIGGTVYIGSTDDNVYAINATTGAQVWKFATAGKVSSSPAVSEEVVYVGSQDENLYALNARTGVELWKYAGAGAFESPAVFNGTVYVGSDDGVLTWINAYSGDYIVKATFSSAVVITPTSVANGIVYIGNANGYVYGFYVVVSPIEGWRAATGGAVTGAPAIANGVVYVASQDFSLYAYDLNGSTQVKSPPPRPDPATLRPNLELKPYTSQ